MQKRGCSFKLKVGRQCSHESIIAVQYYHTSKVLVGPSLTLGLGKMCVPFTSLRRIISIVWSIALCMCVCAPSHLHNMFLLLGSLSPLIMCFSSVWRAEGVCVWCTEKKKESGIFTCSDEMLACPVLARPITLKRQQRAS